MTNKDTNKIIINFIEDIKKRHLTREEVIEKLKNELSLDDKLMLFRYYLEAKYTEENDNEIIIYNKEDSLPKIIENIIPFVVVDCMNSIEIYKQIKQNEMLKALAQEFYNFLNLAKVKFGMAKIKVEERGRKEFMKLIEDIAELKSEDKNNEK